MSRSAFVLSCVIHGSALAVVGWSSLLVAPPAEHPGSVMSVSLSPSDTALVSEDTFTPEFTAMPEDVRFTPPEPMIEPMATPMAGVESAPPSILSTSTVSEMPPLAPARKELAPRIAGNSGRRHASSSKDSTMTAGGGSSSGFLPPQFLVRHKPQYPAPARAQRLEGMVLLLISVDADGRVAGTSVRRSSGYLVLDRAALESVRSWLFSPARQGDHRVPATVEVPIRFAFSALGGN